MKPQVPALRLRLPRVEKTPKRVHAERWQDFAGIKKNQSLVDELDGIIEGIGRGDGAPEAHYRAGMDRDRDGLLEERGIMHLHLGGKDSDTLVFLIQYADQVVLLESNTHMHFRTQPPGKNILALSQSWLAELEHDMQAAAEESKSAEDAVARAAAEARRARIAASLAALKRKDGGT